MCGDVTDCELFPPLGNGGRIKGKARVLRDEGLMLGPQAYLYDNDDRFFPGWRLDTSWILCTVSWSVMVLLAAGLSASAFLLSPEGGYELIPDAH